MTDGHRQPAGRVLADGAVRGFAAELLLLPTGLVTAAVLARVLGPADYGRFSLAASIVGWLTLSTIALLGRAAIKVVSEAPDWRPVAATLLRARLAIGVATSVLLIVLAGLLAIAFDARTLAPLLQVFAVDILLANLVRAHRETLTAIGQYRAVAGLSMLRWLIRMVLILVLVALFRSVMAAVVATVLTTLIELLLARRRVHMPWRHAQRSSMRALWTVAAPLLVFGLAFQLHTRVDLFAVTVLQRHVATVAQQTGWFGAAQNLAVAPGLFMMTVAPLLLATLGRLQRDGEHIAAVAMSRDVLRVTTALLPGAALVAVCATELVTVIFGANFQGAAPLLGPLFAGGLALCILAVAVSVLTAADHTSAVSRLGLLLLGSAAIGHWLVVPRFGAVGAAWVTLASSAFTCIVAMWSVFRAWGVQSVSTFLRSFVIGAIIYAAGMLVITTSWWALILKLVVLSILWLVVAVLIGELSRADRARLHSLWRGRMMAVVEPVTSKS